jgi:hypothetical protein
MANEKGPPASRASVARLIESLDCLDTVDTMLLEGTPAIDVARFIQQDQGELAQINEKTLANALIARRHQKQEVIGMAGRHDVTGSGAGTAAPRQASKTPGTLIHSLYNRTKGGIQEMLEMEALFLAQRDRVDRAMETENELGALSEDTGKEIERAASILMDRFNITHKLGLTENGDNFRLNLDIRGYSERTAEILNNPESRHRVISIVERIAAHAKRAMPTEPEIALPLPRSLKTGDGNKE